MDNLVLYHNIDQCLTLAGAAQKEGRNPSETDLGIIHNASAVIDNETNIIQWIGPAEDLPAPYKKIIHAFSGEGEIWLPELVECHTHLVFGGERHHDYALRCSGKSYQQVAAEGGGILSTLKHTREASLETLVDLGMKELDRFQKYGVGTIEVKSGYGLSLESEMKILDCIHQMQQQTSVALVPTFMPAHATPPEFKGRTDEFVDVICKEWIPEIAKEKLAIFFDVFVEQGYFTPDHAQRLCTTAKENGFGIKLHVDQFTDLGGTELAVELEAKSCDHLDNVSESGISAIAKSKTVAVLLPGASLFTGTPYPPARKLIDAGARVALSTDYNPGTCPSRNLPLMTTLACSQMKMTIPEAIVGITLNAAAALGLEKQLGSLEAGKQFRVCQLKASSYEVLPYCFGELG